MVTMVTARDIDSNIDMCRGILKQVAILAHPTNPPSITAKLTRGFQIIVLSLSGLKEDSCQPRQIITYRWCAAKV